MRKIVAISSILVGVLLLGACDEDGMVVSELTTFDVRVENVSQVYDFVASGVFNTPVGADGPGPLVPGGTYEARFHAAPGTRLSFATMFVPSNDYFYAPGPEGIALFDGNGDPVSGDVTAQVRLWDAGTEVNQEPGMGADQAPTQAGPDTGAADDDDTVREAEDTHGNLPATASVLRVTIEHLGENEFRLSIENVSDGTTLMTSGGGAGPVPLAPGVYVVHANPAPLFEEGAADPGVGLEALAEDGNPASLGQSLAGRTGLTSPLAPGAYAVHEDMNPLFTPGQPDGGNGLEALAEDGDPSGLGGYLGGLGLQDAGVFNTPEGAGGPGPLMPGNAYTFTVTAEPGDRLSLATMLVKTNDLFYAPGMEGIALFTGSSPISGDVTGQLQLWDAGTEANQHPGTGPDQAPFQAGPDTGAADGDASVRLVDDGYDYPAVDAVVRVTITPTS